MITTLTEEQMARIPEIRDRWLKHGLSTQPADRPRAVAAINAAYKQAGLAAPKIIWCGSPLANGFAREYVKALLTALKQRAQVGAQVKAQVGAQVRAQVWAQVGAQVKAQVWAQVGAQVGDQVRDIYWQSGYGQHDSNWLSFYDFFRVVCGLDEITAPLLPLTELAQSAGWFLPHEHWCFVSERHNVLNRNTAGQLHCETGAALAYPDGWSIYATNGVRLEPWMIETRAEEIDPSKVLTVENVEQRRELLRRVGIERMLHVLPNKRLNKKGDYELLSVRLSDQVPDARYLKMLNPSIGVWHMEGVHPSCKTVQEAINWRAGGLVKGKEIWQPAQLT